MPAPSPAPPSLDVAELFDEIAGSRGIKGLVRRGYDVEAAHLTYHGTPIMPLAFAPDGLETGERARGVGTFSPSSLRGIRASVTAEYERAFSRWLDAAVNFSFSGSRTAGGLEALTPRERAALSEGVSEAGGFLLPAPLAAGVLAGRANTSVVRQYVTAIPVADSTFRLPLPAEDGSAPELYSSGWRGSWVAENEELSLDDSLSFGLASASLRTARAAVSVSRNLLADSDGLLAWLVEEGGKNLGVLEDVGLLVGDGSANQPLGLVTQFSADDLTDLAGTSANTISSTVEDSGSIPKLSDMLHSLPSKYLPGARWVLRNSVEGRIRLLVDSSGDPVWPRTSDALLGYPLSHTDALAADGTADAKVAIFGDLGAASALGEKLGIGIVVDDINRIGSNELTIWLQSRSALVLHTPSAIAIGNV